jgi:hypothetical protein
MAIAEHFVEGEGKEVSKRREWKLGAVPVANGG